MTTHRESAQFIDELRQHYRRLDGLLVRFRDRLGLADCMEFNEPVLALRKLLFGGIGDPDWPPDAARIERERLNAGLHLVEDPPDEDRELSTAEELYAGTALGRGGGVPW